MFGLDCSIQRDQTAILCRTFSNRRMMPENEWGKICGAG